jgi:hypothetical protein
VRVRPGEGFILDPGAWHWIPFPVGRRRSRWLVVFKARTGQDDLQVMDLSEAITVK